MKTKSIKEIANGITAEKNDKVLYTQDDGQEIDIKFHAHSITIVAMNRSSKFDFVVSHSDGVLNIVAKPMKDEKDD